MGKAIHVPQGRSARLTKNTLTLGIDSLYTNGFSICNIIAVIGQDKIVLIHADLQTPINEIEDEIDWAGEASQVVIVYREEWKDFLTSRLQHYLNDFISANRITLKELKKSDDDNFYGINVSFNTSKDNNIHPNIQISPLSKQLENSVIPAEKGKISNNNNELPINYQEIDLDNNNNQSIRPSVGIATKNLLRHPLEQQFLAIQKLSKLSVYEHAKKTDQSNNTRLIYLIVTPGCLYQNQI